MEYRYPDENIQASLNLFPKSWSFIALDDYEVNQILATGGAFLLVSGQTQERISPFYHLPILN